VSPRGATVTGSQLERRLRNLDPLDVVIALTHRLALAIETLHRIRAACPLCNGKGETVGEYLAYTLTDDPRLLAGGYAYWRAVRLAKFGAMVERQPRARAVLVSPCPECAELRATIKLCEASE
jgi:hypothetical protein